MGLLGNNILMQSTSSSTWSDYVRQWEFVGNSYYDTKANEFLGNSSIPMGFVTGTRSGKTAIQANINIITGGASTIFESQRRQFNIFPNPVATNQFSMSYWYTSGTGLYPSIWDGGVNGDIIYVYSQNGNLWSAYIGATIYGSTASIVTNTLYHVCFTVDNYNYKLYINGSLILSKTLTRLYSTAPITMLGNFPTSPAYNPLGKFESIYQWARTLTATEITEIYNQG